MPPTKSANTRRDFDSRFLAIIGEGRKVGAFPKSGLILLLLAIAGLTVLPPLDLAYSLADSGDLPSPGTTHPQPDLTYVHPTQKTKAHNYFFDAFGPYPIVGAAFAAGISQARGTPPEWKRGAEGYGERFGSNFAIAAVSTTTRYALAEAFREDTLYYRCECKGVFQRLSHAVISTLTARRGEDGHRVFSFPALVAPCAGTMTAVYGWYPGRYDAKDAFRMGNDAVLGFVGGNIGLEFLYSGPHSDACEQSARSARSGFKPVSDRKFRTVAGMDPPLPGLNNPRQTYGHNRANCDGAGRS